jgi:uncharacterized protein
LKAVDTAVIVADLAALEFSASISRFVRMGQLAGSDATTMLARFDEIRASSAQHAHDGADYRLADDLIRDFATKLAAPDALHLASALNLGATLVTFDQRLAEAARGRGAKVLTPA